MDLMIIQKNIFEIRGQRVMLDKHLAELYGVETRILIQAVKRNIKRFPVDFMFQLNEIELNSLRSQFVISKKEGRGGARYLPFAFTEHGITMLSSVLRSETAINVNIAIVRAFILLKQYNNNFRFLQKRIDELEAKFNTKIENINEVIELLLAQPQPAPEPKVKKVPKRTMIGFKLPKKNKRKF
ncbi:MAG: ORF6N domain-containing protein [Bacteroidetes bacterium]|nr:ORF6N domain-containing protein [Bacteroidota bacterium]